MEAAIEEKTARFKSHCTKLKDNINKLDEICHKSQVENDQLAKILDGEINKFSKDNMQTLSCTEQCLNTTSKTTTETISSKLSIKEGVQFIKTNSMKEGNQRAKRNDLTIKVVPANRKENDTKFSSEMIQSNLKLIEKTLVQKRQREVISAKEIANKENIVNNSSSVKELRVRCNSRNTVSYTHLTLPTICSV
eukprot:TRINITY_DN15497_c0_g1_i1.p2 TRINITY_DN15497_c0_g1~~TRINITY_DN15497_c0_g1_i1.p2  ORF type:complete len:193 (+),score=41.89 TRINITY_DN15497_c0_g1_i1:114-692(+)